MVIVVSFRVKEVHIGLVLHETERNGCVCVWRKGVQVLLHRLVESKVVELTTQYLFG